MNKGLEKLKTIRHIHDMECGKDESINKDFDIIEKELKKGIAARKFLVAITREYTKEDFEGFTIDDLNDEIKEHGISYTFTQEELDLLKEEILCH